MSTSVSEFVAVSVAAPSPGHEPFGALDACHKEVMTALNRMAHFVNHLDDQGVDTTARAMATELLAFFTQTARQHHADEEQQIFPALLKSEDTVLVQHVERLQQDHGWLEEDWLTLSPQLEAVAQGYSWYDIDALRQGLSVFTELYLDHIDLEESLIYPEAKRLMAEREQAGMGRQSAQMRHRATN